MRRLLLTFTLATATVTAQQATLSELARIARARNTREQPERVAMLEPFMKDLELEYNDANRGYLNRRLAQIEELGDAIVPQLLEKLVPPEEAGPTAQNVVANTARVLRALGPAGFVDDLLALLDHQNHTTRQHAISLLGHSDSLVAANAISARLPDMRGPMRLVAIAALSNLRAEEAADMIAAYLLSDDAQLRGAAMAYLSATRAAGALDRVLQALAQEQDDARIEPYVDYLEVAAPDNAKAAEALLRFVTVQTTDIPQAVLVCRALRTIAPEGHAPTIATCREVIAGGDIGTVGFECGRTMRALGAADGFDVLLDQIKQRIRREPKVGAHYATRGDVNRELEEWARAARDYEDAIERTSNWAMKRRYYLLIAGCEAQRKRWNTVVTALRESRATRPAILEAAQEDPGLARALDNPTVKRFLEDLPR